MGLVIEARVTEVALRVPEGSPVWEAASAACDVLSIVGGCLGFEVAPY